MTMSNEFCTPTHLHLLFLDHELRREAGAKSLGGVCVSSQHLHSVYAVTLTGRTACLLWVQPSNGHLRVSNYRGNSQESREVSVG